MKVSGFTIIKDGVKYHYYFEQAILSILPICDEFIINYGESEDETLERLLKIKQKFPEKIKIIRTLWDESLREGGKILSIQTNIALELCSGDWCFYIQADEVVHEKYLPEIKKNLEKYLDEKNVEGFALNYLHFYGNFFTYFDRRPFYRREVRIIRNNGRIRSVRDAQGFRVDGKRKPRVKIINAYIYHYGWVRPEKIMLEKMKNIDRYWHDDDWISERYKKITRVFHNFEGAKFFRGEHPKLMQDIIAKADWQIIPSPEDIKIKSPFKFLLNFIEEKILKTQIFEHKNFKPI
jgi:glycosyltransferase involved in cell wall biosynthesis